MKKQIVSVISWLLAIAMLVSMPVCAFAEEGDPQWEGGETVAQTDEAPASVPETQDGIDGSTSPADETKTVSQPEGEEPKAGAQADGAESKAETKPTTDETKKDETESTGSKNDETKPKDDETKPKEPEWKTDGRFVKLLADVDVYKNWTDQKRADTWKKDHTFTINKTATINGVTWWEVRNNPPYYYIKAKDAKFDVYANTPITDTTVAKNSVATLNETCTAYALPNSPTVVGEFNKGFSFTVLETKKYEFDIWAKAALGDDGTGWFNLKYATVEAPQGGSNPGDGSGSTSGQATGVISHSGNVNVRKKPDASAIYFVRSIAPGTEVVIYEKKVNEVTHKEWARIGVDEWVCMDYIKITSGGTPSDGTGSDTKPEETEKPLFKGVVTSTTNLRVREAAGTDKKQVGSLPKGTEISVYEKTLVKGIEWGRIGEKKWVCLQYVQVTEQDPGASEGNEGDGDTSDTETPIASGTVTSNVNLKVRTGPGTNYPIKTSLVKGSKISIYATKTVNGVQWGRIGKDQWVCLSYVNVDSGNINGGNTDSSSSTANATVVNCSKAVNVRATPSASGAFVAQISLNTRIFISETKKVENGTLWGKVDNGWVCMDYVKMDDNAVVDDGSGTVSTTSGAPYANITVPATVKGGVDVCVNAGNYEKTLLTLGNGMEINITGRALVNDRQWGKLNINGYTGWVEMRYIELKELSTTVSTAQVKAYDKPSMDGKEVDNWGKGKALTITEQKTDGTYLWGKVKGTEMWVNMASLAIKTEGDSSETPVATISIIAKVKESADMISAPSNTGKFLMSLSKNTKIEITDLECDENGNCMGRVTVNNVAVKPVTGWVYLDDVSQTSVSGKISVDSANLYRTLGGNPASLKLKKNSAVTVLERTEYSDGEVYGKLRINNAFYWVKMSNVSLGNANPPVNTGDTGNTGSTGNVGDSTGSTVDTPTGATNVSGVVKSTYVNVRSEASARSKLVTQLKLGDKVTVYEQTIADGATWGKIDQGWVAMEYINLSSRPTTTGNTGGNTTIMTSVPSGAVAVGFVNYDGLTIRSGAGTGYDKVGSLKKGTNVVITEQKLSGGMIWGKIDKGWICTSYVTMTGASITGSGTAGTIARCAYTVNVRNNPGVGNALVAKILVNSRVEILETRVYSGEQWGRTSLGWVSMQYVLLDN